MIELHVRESADRPSLLFDSGRTVTIGRDDGCVVPIEDIAASRVHCIVTFRSGHWLLRDVDSRNGTLVNQETVQTRALHDGDVIRIGRTDIAVRIALRPPTPPPPAPELVIIARPAPAPAPAPKSLTPIPGAPPEVVPGVWPRSPSEDAPVDARPQPLTFFPPRRAVDPTPPPPPAVVKSSPPSRLDPVVVLAKVDLFAPDPAPAPATPAFNLGVRRRVWTASAWTISFLMHAGLLFFFSLVVIGYQMVTKPKTFVVGLSNLDAETERKSLHSRRPASSSARMAEAMEASEFEDVSIPVFESALPAASSAAVILPPREDMIGVGGYSTLRARGPRSGEFTADLGEPARREAIESALGWLARHQNPDGHWAAADFAQACQDIPCAGAGKALHDTGATALALLAFLGAGYLHGDGPHGAEILAALRWLTAQQAPDGCLAPRKGKYMYSHAIGTAALCAAFALKRSPALHEPARKATELLVASQSTAGGWRYRPGEADADTSVTGWAVLALRRAESAGFPVAKSVYAKIQDFLISVTDRHGHVGYQSPMDLGSRPEDGLDRFPPKEATTAIGIFCREICEPTAGLPPNASSVALVLREHPVWGNEGDEADTIAWVFSAAALARVNSPARKAWDAELAKSILSHQQQEGCGRGSWPAVGPWGASGGRICTTALFALALEAPGGGLLAGLESGASRPRTGKDR